MTKKEKFLSTALPFLIASPILLLLSHFAQAIVCASMSMACGETFSYQFFDYVQIIFVAGSAAVLIYGVIRTLIICFSKK